MLVAYVSHDEVIIVTDTHERVMLQEYFLPTGDRDLEDYDRQEDEHKYDVMVVTASMRSRFE